MSRKPKQLDYSSNLVIDTPKGFVRTTVGDGGGLRWLWRSLLTRALVAALALTALAIGLSTANRSDGVRAATAQTMVTLEGVTINVYVSSVTPQQVYDWLKAAGLRATERLSRVDVVESGYDVTSTGGYPGYAYPSSIQFKAESLLTHPNFTVGHEYGHVWSNYYRWTYWSGSWDAYLEARGVLGDSRVGSTRCWQPDEMIATDYWRLFGAPETQATVARCPSDLPWAEDVPGLREFLAQTWTNGNPPGSGSAAPTPTPAPVTATPTPAPSASPTPTPAPVTQPAPSITDATTVTLSFPNGWNEFVAPLSGQTSRTVYIGSGKKQQATNEVVAGKVYRIKGPVTLEIRAW